MAGPALAVLRVEAALYLLRARHLVLSFHRSIGYFLLPG